MYLNPVELPDHGIYHLMMQTVIPRPVAWVLTDNGEDRRQEDRWNLAPFSLFNAVCDNPPTVMISIGYGGRVLGSPKDTLVNIQSRSRFVVHVAPWDMAQQVSDSSAKLPYGVSEVTQLDLPLVDFDGWPVPRIEGARVAFACTRSLLLGIGRNPQTLVFGEIHRIWLDDRIVRVDPAKNNRVTVDALLHDPLVRLGGDSYCRLGDQIHIPRPDHNMKG